MGRDAIGRAGARLGHAFTMPRANGRSRSDAFISYAREDLREVSVLRDGLRKARETGWRDQPGFGSRNDGGRSCRP